MEGEDKNKKAVESPTNSQQTVSDDDVIDYSIKPEFYDSDLDEKNEKWADKQRRGSNTDAVLSCPACFTTLCLECQRHEKYLTQYRAVFVRNCTIMRGEVRQISLNQKRGKRKRDSGGSKAISAHGETYKKVCCSVCSTEVGVIDEEEVYHFFDVLPGES